MTVESTRSRVDRATIAYYGMEDTIMPDSEYDALFEQAYGDTTTPFDLYKSLFVADGRRRDLAVPMLSLSKARKAKEVSDWLAKVRRFSADAVVHLAPKYDGLACLVEVREGHIVSATTRGNGTVGEDVTYAVQHIPSNETFSTDGFHQVEVCMSVENFAAVNAVRAENGNEPYKHPRNAAAGLLRATGGAAKSHVAYLSLHHHFSAGEYGVPGELTATDERPVEQVMTDYRDELLRQMDVQHTAVLTDGVVLFATDRDGNLLRDMGDDGSAPRWSTAWKFPNTAQVATVVDIHWQTGRTKNTPVATFNPPVDFDGVLVSRASLHNADRMAELGVQIGDQVELVRSNEVIPYVTALHAAGSDRRPAPEEPAIEMTTNMLLSLMVGVLDIRGLGGTRIAALGDWIDENYNLGSDDAPVTVDLLNILDEIADTPDMLTVLDGVADKGAVSIAASIRTKMNAATMVQWLACLGIPGVGRRMWTTILGALGGARQVLSALVDDTPEIPSVGPKRIRLLRDNLNDIDVLVGWVSEYSPDISQLDEQPDNAAKKDTAQPSAVVTGKIDGITRDGIATLLADRGWQLAGSVTAETTVLFNASGRESSKVIGARKKGVTIVDVSPEAGAEEIDTWIANHNER